MQIKNQAHFKADRVYILHIKCGEKKRPQRSFEYYSGRSGEGADSVNFLGTAMLT